MREVDSLFLKQEDKCCIDFKNCCRISFVNFLSVQTVTMSRLKLGIQVSLTGCVPVNVESGAKYEYGTGLSTCVRFPSHADLLGFKNLF